jgi:hypothetical protein
MTECACPSGLRGRVRGMKVREEKILTDRQLAKRGGQLDELLGACWEETVEPGPYSIVNRLDWSKVLQGDRFYALMQIRIATYGPEYAFAMACKNVACRARIDWELNLSDLRVRMLSDESRAALQGGNRIEAQLPESGRRVWFKLLTGEDERKLARAASGDREGALSHVLALRVVEIEGVEPQARVRFLEDLSLRDADYLFDTFDAHECGVDTAIEIECPECLEVQDVELPFDQGFFLPGRERSKRRRGQQTFSRG